MVIYLFVCLGIAFAWYAVATSKGKINIINTILFTIIGYVFTHIVFSAGLLWLDQYSIKRTVFLCMLCWLGFATIAIVKKKKFQIDWDIKPFVLPIVISLIGLPFVIQTFGFYGFDQDEGVYQTQAICFIHGMTERQIDIEEYYYLDTPQEQDMMELVTGEDYLIGFYKVYDEAGEYYVCQSEEQAISERSGVFHGIPTFSALLALWGRLFGIEHMMGINTVLYDCVIFVIALICDRFKLKAIGKGSALLIFALSPLVIWVSKSALTEMGLTLIGMTFLYFLLGDTKEEITMSAICVTMYAVYHVSVYVFMPLYVVLYVCLYLYSKKKDYIVAMIIAVLGYIVGYWMMQTVAAQYTTGNYARMYRWFINAENAPFIIMVVCGIVIGAGLILLVKGKSIRIRWNKNVIAWGVRFLIGISVLCLIYYLMRKDINLHQLSNVTIISYMVLTGIAISGIVYSSVIVTTKKWFNDSKMAILLGVFLYCIVLYSMCFKPIGEYYYYYTRYLTMYIPLIAIMGGIILARIQKWKAFSVLMLSITCILPFDKCLLIQKDDTRVEWNTLLNIADVLQEDDKVVLDGELFRYYYFPLKAMAGVDVYPVFDDFEGELRKLSSDGQPVYYLTISNTERAEEICSVRLRITNHKSEDDNMILKDYLNNNHHRITLLPLYFEETKEVIQLYQYN